MTDTIQHKAKDFFLAQFPATERHESAFLKGLRDASGRALKNLGFPSRRDEAWKYTGVSDILKGQYAAASSPARESIPPAAVPGARRIVLVNGLIPETLPDDGPEGMHVTSFRRADESILRQHLSKYADHRNDAFTALNTTSFDDGLLVHIPDKSTAGAPLHIIHLVSGKNPAAFPRLLIVAGKASTAEVIVSYESGDGEASFTNGVTEVAVGEGASLSLSILQHSAGRQINTIAVSQQAGSRFTVHTVTLAGELVRNNLSVALNGGHCESGLYGLYLTGGTQHVDNHTLVDHQKPACNSSELYKGVMADRSTAVFNGKVFVRPNAQQTNAFQANRNILLSDGASVNSKPELEIYADDVKCSHGSTTGQMDEEALFYLRSRGLGRDSAMKLMIHAFASEVLDSIGNEELRSAIAERVSSHRVFS